MANRAANSSKKNNAKNTKNNKNNGNSKNAQSKSDQTKPRKPTKAELRAIEERRKLVQGEVTSILCIGFSLLMIVCLFLQGGAGILGKYAAPLLLHLFGIGAVVLPVVLLAFSVQTLFDKKRTYYKYKLFLFLGFFIAFISLMHIMTCSHRFTDISFPEYVSEYFFKGDLKNGGLIGALFGGVLYQFLGKIGSYIILFVLSLSLLVMATGKTVSDILRYISDAINGVRYDIEEYRSTHFYNADEDFDEEEYYDIDEDYEPEQMQIHVEKLSKKQKKNNNKNGASSARPRVMTFDITDEEENREESVDIAKDIVNSSKNRYKNNNTDENIMPDLSDIIGKVENSRRAEEGRPLIINIDNDNETEGYVEDIQSELVSNTDNDPSEKAKEDTPPWEEKKEDNVIVLDRGSEKQALAESGASKSDENEPEIIEAERTRTIKNLDNNAGKTPYKFPSTSILARNPKRSGGSTRDEMLAKSRKLEETLSVFGVDAKVVNISRGPAVTRYELIPPKGITVNKITKLDKDIELALAAKSVRIEAPIPGTSKIGIELGNESVSPVYFSEVLLTDKFRDFKSKLAFGIGKDITGTVIVADIADMTHLLIAGATGAGKSVCINTLITSILYKATPQEVKLIMIDPKKVELNVYNGIPHLLIPVVSDVQKANGALNWAIREMMRRYDLLELKNVRNIVGYNKVVDEEDRLPYIVIIIDELADLMMTVGKEVEASIVRLTQLARAAGIHLVIATQRPDSNVVTGLIKANVPSRIAFKVSDGVNSKIILDSTGAEKLLGKGDMLLKTRAFDDKPLRIQGAFVTDEEVEKIVASIKTDEDHYDQSVIDEIERSVAEATTPENQSSSASSDNNDGIIDDVIKFVVFKKRASISAVQRKFGIGYNKAARIIDELEERGIVGPDLGGTKGREVYMDKYEWEERQRRYEE